MMHILQFILYLIDISWIGDYGETQPDVFILKKNRHVSVTFSLASS